MTEAEFTLRVAIVFATILSAGLLLCVLADALSRPGGAMPARRRVTRADYSDRWKGRDE